MTLWMESVRDMKPKFRLDCLPSVEPIDEEWEDMAIPLRNSVLAFLAEEERANMTELQLILARREAGRIYFEEVLAETRRHYNKPYL